MLDATDTAPQDARAAELVRHPAWCRHTDETDPRAGDPLGSVSYYDKLAPAEPDSEHEGREYRLDAGETFAYAVTVNATQLYEAADGRVDLRAPQVRLAIRNLETVDPGATVFLEFAEVDKLIRMLERARSDVRS